MARNDYLNAPVRMKALQGWIGKEGKVRRGDQIVVTEARARELEGFERSGGRTFRIDGTRIEAGQPIRTRARAVRVENKGGPRPDDATKGKGDKRQEEVERKNENDTPAENADKPASAAAQALAEEHGIRLEDVEGSGALGRVTKPDVEAHIEWLENQPKPTGDAQLDAFVQDLRESSMSELLEQNELYRDEEDQRYVGAVRAEIDRREESGA